VAFSDHVAQARATLHAQLGLAATYTPPGPAAETVDVTVRVVRQLVNHGDLDRQGFAKVREDINSVVLDTGETGEPLRNARVVVPDLGEFRIDDVEPADGLFRTCTVIRVPA